MKDSWITRWTCWVFYLKVRWVSSNCLLWSRHCCYGIQWSCWASTNYYPLFRSSQSSGSGETTRFVGLSKDGIVAGDIRKHRNCEGKQRGSLLLNLVNFTLWWQRNGKRTQLFPKEIVYEYPKKLKKSYSGKNLEKLLLIPMMQQNLPIIASIISLSLWVFDWDLLSTVIRESVQCKIFVICLLWSGADSVWLWPRVSSLSFDAPKVSWHTAFGTWPSQMHLHLQGISFTTKL